MKKLLSLGLAVVMVFGLVACGNGGAETTAPAENNPAAAASYTYKSYMTALGTNWNPHAWEMSNEQTILSYLEGVLMKWGSFGCTQAQREHGVKIHKKKVTTSLQ